MIYRGSNGLRNHEIVKRLCTESFIGTREAHWSQDRQSLEEWVPEKI